MVGQLRNLEIAVVRSGRTGAAHLPAGRSSTRAREAAPSVVALPRDRRSPPPTARDVPTVARFLLAGRPLPRIEDAVKIGELMRRAALAQFGWHRDEAADRWIPKAPWEVSGRGADGRPLKDPSHRHAFWLPEDADGDGWIDHVSVFVAGGMSREVQARLDRITRLWLAPKQRSEEVDAEPGSVKEWRLALEGFGRPADFGGGARIFGTARRWRSRTPFLASGHLKGAGYPGEVQRLLKRRGLDATDVDLRCGRPSTSAAPHAARSSSTVSGLAAARCSPTPPAPCSTSNCRKRSRVRWPSATAATSGWGCSPRNRTTNRAQAHREPLAGGGYTGSGVSRCSTRALRRRRTSGFGYPSR